MSPNWPWDSGATVVVAGILTLAVTWWSRGFDILSANQYANFDERDIAPIGYAAFAFTLGALAGAVVRRILPAMAITLAGFVAVRLAVMAWVRPHLFTPIRTIVALTSAPSFEIRGTKDGPALTGVSVQAPGHAKRMGAIRQDGLQQRPRPNPGPENRLHQAVLPAAHPTRAAGARGRRKPAAAVRKRRHREYLPDSGRTPFPDGGQLPAA